MWETLIVFVQSKTDNSFSILKNFFGKNYVSSQSICRPAWPSIGRRNRSADRIARLNHRHVPNPARLVAGDAAPRRLNKTSGGASRPQNGSYKTETTTTVY
jgi:hypothetical protein